MLVLDAQTSGGLLMAAKPNDVDNILIDLKINGYLSSMIVGEVIARKSKSIYVV